jgi:CysZ protein
MNERITRGFFQDFFYALSAYPKAIRFINKHGLYVYFIYPFLLSIAIFFLGIWATAEFSKTILMWLLQISGVESHDFFMKEILLFVILLILKILLFIIFAYIGGFVVLILLSPVLSYLSEKTEEKITGKKYTFSAIRMLKDVGRSVIINAKNFIFQSGITILLIIIGFIPFIGIISPVLLFSVTAYFYGFAFIDYNNERLKLSVSESSKLAYKNKGVTTGLGTVYTLALLIPVAATMIYNTKTE